MNTRISLNSSIAVLEALIAENEGTQDSYTLGVVFGYKIAVKELKRAQEAMKHDEQPCAV